MLLVPDYKHHYKDWLHFLLLLSLLLPDSRLLQIGLFLWGQNGSRKLISSKDSCWTSSRLVQMGSHSHKQTIIITVTELINGRLLRLLQAHVSLTQIQYIFFLDMSWMGFLKWLKCLGFGIVLILFSSLTNSVQALYIIDQSWHERRWDLQKIVKAMLIHKHKMYEDCRDAVKGKAKPKPGHYPPFSVQMY